MFWFKSFRKFFRKIAIFRNFDHWSEILSVSAGRPLGQGVCPSLILTCRAGKRGRPFGYLSILTCRGGKRGRPFGYLSILTCGGGHSHGGGSLVIPPFSPAGVAREEDPLGISPFSPAGVATAREEGSLGISFHSHLQGWPQPGRRAP